jgi:molecular chaperone GrpE
MNQSMDFMQEIHRLLGQEALPPTDELAEIVAVQTQNLGALGMLGGKLNDVSLQIEEIYDLVKESDASGHAAQEAQRKETQLVRALIALSDVLDSFVLYAQGQSEIAEQARLMAAQIVEVLAAVGLKRIGRVGERVNPKAHEVHDVVPSPIERDAVAQILQTGYSYNGKVLRRAIVVVSGGPNAV